MYQIIFLAIYVLFSNQAFLQEEKKSFDEVSLKDLRCTSCAFEPAAPAEIIYEYNQSVIDYEEYFGFKLFFKKYVQIKIYNTKGFEYGKIEIPLFRSEEDQEKLKLEKAYTYNLVDGRIKKEKLKRSSITAKKIGQDKVIKLLEFPSIKDGSIIELEYTISSMFFERIRDWDYQKTIPVRWSEYKAELPEFYHYGMELTENTPLFKAESNRIQNRMLIRTRVDTEGKQYEIPPYAVNELKYQIFNFEWAAKEIPAYKIQSDPYSEKIPISKIDLELEWIQFPNESRVEY